MFAYCNNCPVNCSDPSGHELISLTTAAVYVLSAITCAIVCTLGISFISSVQQGNINHRYESKNKDAKKPINLPSWKKLKIDIDHITSGHMPNGSRNPDDKKSVFAGLTISQVIRAIHEAYNNSSKLATVGDRIKLRGYSSEFNLVIEIWINISNYIIETAYPKG